MSAKATRERLRYLAKVAEDIIVEVQPTGDTCRGCDFFDDIHFCDIFGYISEPKKIRPQVCIKAQEWFDSMQEDAMLGGE